MEENYLGYLLNALDEGTRCQVEDHLAQQPEARDKLALLESALQPLAADADAPTPPPLLVERTLARVAEQICASTRPTIELPPAPPLTPAAVSTGRAWWRRADVLVAACLLLTIGGVTSVLLGRMRGPDSAVMLTECKNNLRQFYLALQKYQEQHGKFPDIDKQSPRNVAGMVVPMLQEAGTLPQSASIRCPGVGTPVSCQISLASLQSMSDAEFTLHSPCLSMCYAYSLGFHDEGGRYHSPGDVPLASWSQTPIMADRPPTQGVLANSMNHSGAGQNVLFADGHVRFLPKRTVAGGDDIFLNRANDIAAGLDAADVVLGHSSARPK